MLSFPKKRNTISEAGRLSRWTERKQRQTADFLNNKTSAWTRSEQLLFLVATCAIFILVICLILVKKTKPAAVKDLASPVMIRLPPDPRHPTEKQPPVLPDTLKK